MSTPQAPLRNARLVALSLAWCFAVISGSMGLNSLIKSNQSQSSLKKQVPPPTVLVIDVSDAFDAGVFATTASTLISVLVFNYISMMLLPKMRAFSTKTLRPQAYSLFFCVVWLIGAQIPFTFFFATRSAGVRAFIGSVELPASIIASTEKALGTTSVYKKMGYLRLTAVFPWLTILFTTIAAVVLFIAASRITTSPPDNLRSSSPATTEKQSVSEKESSSQTEKV